MHAFGRSLAFMVWIIVSGTAATAQPGSADGYTARHVTAEGVAVVMPAVAALDCTAMRDKLDEIDASGYRDASPLPKNEADMALLDYENRLSGAYFTRCLRSNARTAEPDGAFARGFKAAAEE